MSPAACKSAAELPVVRHSTRACDADTSELKDALTHLPSTCDVLFFPLNDSAANATPGAGTHWSLLVADLAAKHTMHLDSGGGDGNSQPAAEFAQKLAAAAGGTWSHSEPACPKQDNTSDCGVFCALFYRSTMQALSAADGSPLTEHNVSQSCKGLVDGASSSLRASCLESACSAAEHGK